ncbi:acyl-CoA thioesterase [Aureimonas fodinaquatilis]|uniref:Acyl-CoA thioesterase n=1 Tax=Aureimonas fodinaquatilis TaxID=2565783 RepID=A0A5B0DZ76_9HYPH|nr:hotdog domain-containing protein [Aureimonas fodinaquatilis]KAA0971688.1 acyl-CoA thioesterase [Aureimonas fodinaquatilis]
MTAPKTCLIDIVFPGDTNHHGTLFGGVGLAHMDKLAFITAGRYAHCDFVTASCERIDFRAPCRLGDIVELEGRIHRTGRRSLGVEVELVAEDPLSGERRSCATGIFNMVAVGTFDPPAKITEHGDLPGMLRVVDFVFPGSTSHYGSLYGGEALASMAKAAFVCATRHCRKAVVLASTRRIDFEDHIQPGEVMEITAFVETVGRSAMTIAVELRAENLHTGVARRCGGGQFVMVAVNSDHRPVAADTAG